MLNEKKQRIDAEKRIPSPKAKELFHDIRRKHEIGKNDLLASSGLTVSTLTRVLDELVSTGIISESGLGASTGGRRPILYQVKADYGYAFGLDISRVSSRLVLLDLAGTKIDSREWRMTEETTPEVLMQQVTAQVKAWMDKHLIAYEQVIGMGIGAVGPLDREAGVIEDPEWFAAPGWSHVPAVHMLEDRLRFPVILDNGANTALIAESWANRTKDFVHMLYVHGGTGLRLGMMTDNKLIHGAADMEGSFGQMIIQADGLPYRTAQGNYGALDTYASVHAIEREVNSRLRTGRSSSLRQMLQPGEPAKFPDIMQALKLMDPMVTEIVTQAATYFGIGLANLLNILYPEKVILGGPLMTDSNLFFYTATQTAIRKTYHYPKYQVIFSKGTYGEEAIAIGAAQLMLSQLTV
ncbi:ROK family protein [Paenibacillus dokdonensis]|uniref:ROK family protein n=1 Tax=Paenibacillus dokdonensis TaxID=2567944 RepID=A0ABU6GUU5_9BACL|nr:ROK family protein [Paenibacillus dokdonensis]MEC0241927.1 ROK family protein [Paenibacillus dokdonensis]